MNLTKNEQEILDGNHSKSTKKAMEILVALGTIFDAEKMIPISSVQIAGVSYSNLGDAGLKFLTEMADGGGKALVLTTLNPAGMDIDNWEAMGISEDFAEKQKRVINAFARMKVITTCSCTPYLFGNVPHFGENIAWSESSAVCYSNSVLGARTNREGGSSALAASLTGRTPKYGFHLDENRHPTITVVVENQPTENHEYGGLGLVIGKKLEATGKKSIPYIKGIQKASVENLKSFCASIATYGGTALFHMEDITPESDSFSPPKESFLVSMNEIKEAISSLNEPSHKEIDFVSLGCPHLTINEIARIAELLEGQKVTKEFWITTSRPMKQISDIAGYTKIIEESGALFAVDTCCVVAPIRGRFNTLATDSAKACYYAYSKNKFKTVFLSFDDVVREAIK